MQKIKPKILIRVDSNQEIGGGHAMRMLALSSMLHKEFNIYVAFKKMPENFQKLYSEFGAILINLSKIKSNTLFESNIIKINDFDIVVIDGYESLNSFKKFCLQNKIKLVLVDDLLIDDFEADLIINHSPGLKKKDFKKLKKTTLCLGFEYALIQKCFLDKAKSQARSLERRDGIFLNLGASDPKEITAKLIDIILKNTNEKITCVLGPLNKNSALVKESFKNEGLRVNFFDNLSSENISNLLISSKIGICSASTISIEAFSCRLPLIVGWSAKNQSRFYKKISQLGLAKGIGNFEELDLDILLDSLKELIFSEKAREKMIRKQIKYFDGKSPERIVKAMKSLL